MLNKLPPLVTNYNKKMQYITFLTLVIMFCMSILFMKNVYANDYYPLSMPAVYIHKVDSDTREPINDKECVYDIYVNGELASSASLDELNMINIYPFLSLEGNYTLPSSGDANVGATTNDKKSPVPVPPNLPELRDVVDDETVLHFEIKEKIPPAGYLLNDSIKFDVTMGKNGKLIYPKWSYSDNMTPISDLEKFFGETPGQYYQKTPIANKVDSVSYALNNELGVGLDVSVPAPYIYVVTSDDYDTSYTPTGSVKVKHITEDGEILADWEDVLADAEEDTPYETQSKSFEGYEFLKMDDSSDPVEGKVVSNKTLEVVYVYKALDTEEPEQQVGSVRVKYITEDGEILKDWTFVKQDEPAGEEYSTHEEEFDGYVYKEMDGTSAPAEGNIEANKTLDVIYVYEAIPEDPEERGIVYVKHIDIDTKEILDQGLVSESIGENYETTKSEFEGYEFVRWDEDSDEENGTVEIGEKTVIYLYKKIVPSEEKPSEEKQDPTDSNADPEDTNGDVNTDPEDIKTDPSDVKTEKPEEPKTVPEKVKAEPEKITAPNTISKNTPDPSKAESIQDSGKESAKTTESIKPNESNSPKTGDDENVLGFAALFITALGLAYGMRKKIIK